MQNIIIDMKQNGQTPYILQQNAALKQQVEDIANNQSLIGFEIARAMLGMVFGTRYPVNIDPLPPGNSSRISVNSTEDISKGALSIYPNPASQSTIIEALLPPDAEKGQVIIYDILGKQNAAFNLHAGKNILNFNVNTLSPGLYFCVMNTDTGLIDKQKIVVLSSH